MYLSISVFLHLLIYDAVLFSMHVYMLILAAAKMEIFRVHTQKSGHKAMRNDRPRMQASILTNMKLRARNPFIDRKLRRIVKMQTYSHVILVVCVKTNDNQIHLLCLAGQIIKEQNFVV